MNFEVKKSEIKFKGIVFDLKVDEIEYNSGNKGIREVAIHNGGAVVIPVTDDGKIVLVKQYRYPLNDWLLELPAGKLEKDEDPLYCASRELVEETGYSANRITKVGKICTTPGFCTEILHIYLATEMLPGNHQREEGEEGMQVFEYSVEEIKALMREGKIIDAKTICGISLYLNL